MSHPAAAAGLGRCALAGAATNRPYSGVAGAVVRVALEDARYGSASARQWLEHGQGRRWVQLLGGDGYLDAALAGLDGR